jgi:hypothetical protein
MTQLDITAELVRDLVELGPSDREPAIVLGPHGWVAIADTMGVDLRQIGFHLSERPELLEEPLTEGTLAGCTVPDDGPESYRIPSLLTGKPDDPTPGEAVAVATARLDLSEDGTEEIEHDWRFALWLNPDRARLICTNSPSRDGSTLHVYTNGTWLRRTPDGHWAYMEAKAAMEWAYLVPSSEIVGSEPLPPLISGVIAMHVLRRTLSLPALPAHADPVGRITVAVGAQPVAREIVRATAQHLLPALANRVFQESRGRSARMLTAACGSQSAAADYLGTGRSNFTEMLHRRPLPEDDPWSVAPDGDDPWADSLTPSEQLPL